MNNNKVCTSRLGYLDFLKTIAIFLVITLHVSLLNFDFFDKGRFILSSWLQYCLRLISEGVPLFFMINGLHLLGRYIDKQKVIKNINHIFLLYIFWSIVFIANKIWSIGDYIGLKDIMQHFITGDYTTILWFYKSLIFVYLLYPIIKMLFDINRKLYENTFWCLLIIISTIRILAEVDIIFREYGGVSGISSFFTEFFPVADKGTASVLFFMLGGMLAKNEILINKYKKILILIAFCAWIIQITWFTLLSYVKGATFTSFWFGNIFSILICIGIFAAVRGIRFGRFTSQIFKIIGSNTNGIYVLHTILLSHIFNPLEGLHGKVIFTIGIMFLSLIISLILGRIPIVRALIKI